jgi:hypothetical protein
MPLTTLLNEGDVLDIRVRVEDDLGNVEYFPGVDGDGEVAAAADPGTEDQQIAAISRFTLTRAQPEQVSIPALSRFTMTRAQPEQIAIAALSRFTFTRAP